MKTAIIIGATGLVGSHLLELLINDDRFDKIKVFSRRRTGQKSDKIEEVIIDFDKPEIKPLKVVLLLYTISSPLPSTSLTPPCESNLHS